MLESDSLRPLLARAPRTLVADAIREVIEEARRHPESAPSQEDAWAAAVADALAARERASLRPVLNATGIVLHTNLGRAPLASTVIEAVRAVASGFSNLEYDVEHGRRGSRDAHCVSLLRELTGAEGALVVNNCAGALVLALHALAQGREAIVSRGELVEIGGSFRIPEIMAASGAILVEVGTTNRTHVDDYRRAMNPRTGAVVKVHRSNFTLEGFVADVSVRELVPIAAECGVPVVHDLGSGLLVPLDAYGLQGEITAAQAIEAGATLVLMSGDKLLGGPQAGIIVGKAESVATLRRSPLARALRVDKVTLAALEATLTLYRDPSRAVRQIPALAMLTAPIGEVRARAERLAAALRDGGVDASVVETEAGVGGGAFPSARIPSAAVAVAGDAVAHERRLRAARPPVIARVAENRLLLDLRSVPEAQDAALAEACVFALASDARAPAET